MRRLTYKGFLKRYVREVSGLETNNLYTLSYVACKELPRLRYPLYAYAKEYEKLRELELAMKKHGFNFTVLTSNIEWEQAKLIQVYDYHNNNRTNEERVKSLMHTKIVQLKNQKGVSNYRIYKDLGLNSGNANAFIKYGDTSKMALSTAERMLEYLKRC